MGDNIEHKVRRALDRRRTLFSETNTTVRLIHDDADGFPGLTVDRLDRAVLVEAHVEHVDHEPVVDALISYLGADTPIFFKPRWSRDKVERGGRQVAGSPCSPELEVREQGLTYLVTLIGGEHIGLFLDSRPARRKVREMASGKRVLNLFSYTGAFGVCALKGGARSTTNVDNKRSALAVARKNYQLNGLSFDTRTFLRADAFQYLRRAAKGKGRYDLIILDPPPISQRPGGRRFAVETGYARLAADCLCLLAPNGVLLAGLNGARVSGSSFEEMVREAGVLADRAVRIVDGFGPGSDFPPCGRRPVARFLVAEVV